MALMSFGIEAGQTLAYILGEGFADFEFQSPIHSGTYAGCVLHRYDHLMIESSNTNSVPEVVKKNFPEIAFDPARPDGGRNFPCFSMVFEPMAPPGPFKRSLWTSP